MYVINSEKLDLYIKTIEYRKTIATRLEDFIWLSKQNNVLWFIELVETKKITDLEKLEECVKDSNVLKEKHISYLSGTAEKIYELFAFCLGSGLIEETDDRI